MPTWAKWLLGCGCAAGLLGALALGGFLVFANSRPRAWHVERALEIAAPPEEVAALVVDLHRWSEWSAWTRDVDAEVTRTFSGPASGTGATVSWSAEPALEIGAGAVRVRVASHDQAKAGNGVLEIVAVEGTNVTLRTTFIDGLVFASSHTDGSGSSSSITNIQTPGENVLVSGSIRIDASGSGSRVVWIEDGSLAEGVTQGLVAMAAIPMISAAHDKLVLASLEGLKARAELGK